MRNHWMRLFLNILVRKICQIGNVKLSNNLNCLTSIANPIILVSPMIIKVVFCITIKNDQVAEKNVKK